LTNGVLAAEMRHDHLWRVAGNPVFPTSRMTGILW
jgi:hypothetical protein